MDGVRMGFGAFGAMFGLVALLLEIGRAHV